MVHQRNTLNLLIKLQKLSREIEVDSDTFATIILYSLTLAAQMIEDLPPSLQMQFKISLIQSLDAVTKEAGEKENQAAWKLLEGLGLDGMPPREAFEQHLASCSN